MKVLQIRTLNGPNVYHNKPVLVMTLDLEDLAEVSSEMLPGFVERLSSLLPGLSAHRCSPGYVGGFIERLNRGTYFAHIIEHIALELSEPAGIGVGYGKSVYGGEPGTYRVIVRYQSEEGMKFLLRTAVDLAQAVARGDSYPLAEKLAEAIELVSDSRLGPSTQAIVTAAEKRGIPWLRLNERSLIQFGYGRNRRLIQATTTSQTSDIAVDIAQDKDLTKKMLEQAMIPVPRGQVVRSEAEAVDAFGDLSVPVATKPLDGNHGRGVSTNLRTREQVAEGYRLAARHSGEVLIEEYFEGKDFRILLVHGKMIAAAERVPASVTGDGELSIAGLIEKENRNPLRGEGHEKPMTQIHVDDLVLAHLAQTGRSLDTIPAAGDIVFLRGTANLSTGGRAIDVTDQIHPETRRACERAARVVGLDICGIDLIVADITRALSEQRGGIIEVNAGPGIRMHHYPSEGKARDVGAAIVEGMYPAGSSARIPIIAITGTNGKTTVTRLIGHVLTQAGQQVGMTTSDGIFVGGYRTAKGDTTGPISARSVLCDPEVEVAVLETARGGIIRRGLAYDWSDVGVLTNITPDHIGQDGIETREDILKIKGLVAERVREGGTLVLNAEDDLLCNLPESPALAGISREVAYFALNAENLAIRRHRLRGGKAYYLRADGWLCESIGMDETALVRASDIPITVDGTATFHIANCLAAIAACRAHGVSIEATVSGLLGFDAVRDNSGRANIYRFNGGYAMVDYGHNPDAFRAVCDMAGRWKGRRVIGVMASPGDRTDEIVSACGAAAARGFDRIIVREDRDLRGRMPGESAALLQAAVRRQRPEVECTIEPDEVRAMAMAAGEMRPGDVVVFFYDSLTEAKRFLDERGAVPVSTIDGLASPGLTRIPTGTAASERAG